MKKVNLFFFFLFLLCSLGGAFAQTHTSVPLDNKVYYVIDSAVLRGLCRAPASAKPWSEATVKELLNEILASSKLSSPEYDVVYGLLAQFDRKPGLNWMEGTYYAEKPLKSGSKISLEAGASWTTYGSMNLASPFSGGTYDIITFYLNGDMGKYVSYNFTGSGMFIYIPRTANPYYDDPATTETDPQTYSLPEFFPYSFTKVWDATVFKPSNMKNYNVWPDTPGFSYEVISEIDASFVDNRLRFRFGRMRRDWGSSDMGSNLFMSSTARPFVAVEGTASPFDWLHFSFLTGILEYMKNTSLTADAMDFQNAFSLAMIEFNFKDYIHFDAGSSTVWPKRFDLGYLFPIDSNFLYQNNIGDFDNLGIFLNLSGQLPGVFRLWLSAYIDEMNLGSDPFFNLDRNMYAYQAGAKINFPWLPFGKITLRYTKVEPYCYTHPGTVTPWYGATPMQTDYVNNGEPIGSYLPPNSDEFYFRIESMFMAGVNAYVQYQMIRHGAEFGPGRVYGSAYSDALPYGSDLSTLYKYFLHDGTYEWNHVVRLGGSYDLKSLGVPISVYGEAGLVFVRYTGIGDGKQAGNSKESYKFISNEYYSPATRFILALGFTVYP